MDNQDRLNTLCPVCDGPVSFEAQRLGEWVHCPHCKELIALGSVEPLPMEHNEPEASAVRDQNDQSGFRFFIYAAVILVILSGGILFRWKAIAVPKPAKTTATEMAAVVEPTPVVQSAVSQSAPPPPPPPPTKDDQLAGQIRQQQEQADRERLIAEMRRANDIAEANARWQQMMEMQSRLQANNQPTEVIQPVEIIEPVQSFQNIEIIQPPAVGVYNGGRPRTGGPFLHNFSGTSGQRGQRYTTVLLNRVSSVPNGY